MEDNYQETFDTWNAIAGLYQEKFMDLRLYDKTYDAFCTAIPQSNARILDAGCGPGNITRNLLAKRPDFRIDGIDIAPNMIELARQNNPAANFQVLDIRELDRLETTYDGIICGFCLPFLSETDCQKLLADACALLSDRGVLYLSFVEGDPEQSGFKTGSEGQRVYFYYHDAAGLSEQLVGLGFAAPLVFRVGFERGDGRALEEHCILLGRR